MIEIKIQIITGEMRESRPSSVRPGPRPMSTVGWPPLELGAKVPYCDGSHAAHNEQTKDNVYLDDFNNKVD